VPPGNAMKPPLPAAPWPIGRRHASAKLKGMGAEPTNAYGGKEAEAAYSYGRRVLGEGSAGIDGDAVSGGG